MCSYVGGVATLLTGLVLVAVSSYVGYGVIPDLVDRIIKSEVQLINGTEQMSRFEEVPFALELNVHIFNITNPTELLSGAVPVVEELGPYVFQSIQSRIIEDMDEDTISYRRLDNITFDQKKSYPLTLDDIVTVVNLPYHGILQMAERLFPNLMVFMESTLTAIFGEHNNPFMTARVGSLLFDGIPLCRNPGVFGSVVCTQIRGMASNVRNIDVMPDGSLEFSILRYKQKRPSKTYVVGRGMEDISKLGIISTYNGSAYLNNWVDQVNDAGESTRSTCNIIRGTDSGMFPPFVDRDSSIFALNTDICRIAELRYQEDTSYEDIPVARFSANEWFLDNKEGCYCLNTTTGLNAENGCLHRGAIELYSCVGAFMVLTYPHFLYADFEYRRGVVGLSPVEDKHRIFVDLEPNTGTVISGMKRAQFNIFFRPVKAISATKNIRTVLMPALWVEEGMQLPKYYVNLLKDRLLTNLRLVDILVPVLITVCCLVAAVGVIILIRVRSVKKNEVVPNGQAN